MKGSPHSVVGADARFLRPGAGLVVTLLALAPAVTLITVLAFRSISTSKDAIIDENAQGLVDTEELCTLFERKVAESRALMLFAREHEGSALGNLALEQGAELLGVDESLGVFVDDRILAGADTAECEHRDQRTGWRQGQECNHQASARS